MAITTSSYAKALWPGVNAWYGKDYAQYPEEWRNMYDVETSKKAYEEDVGQTSFGLMPIKNEGGSVVYDEESQAFTTRYVHTTYGMGFVVTEEAFEDDMYNVVGKSGAKSLAFSVASTLNVLGAAVYNNATSYTGGDGVALLSATHVNESGDTNGIDNLASSTLSEAALETACIDIADFRNDRGLRVMARPRDIIIPTNLEFTLERILKSTLRVETANNDINALKSLGKFERVFISHYITGTTSWYIRTNVPHGMKCFIRRAPKFDMDNEFDTNNAKYKTTFRCSFGFTDWRGMYGYDT